MASKKYIDPKLTLVSYQIEALRCARHYGFGVTMIHAASALRLLQLALQRTVFKRVR